MEYGSTEAVRGSFLITEEAEVGEGGSLEQISRYR
jgi:hypothetical protein